jgi:hypothetical protein
MDVWAGGTYYHVMLALYLAFGLYAIVSIIRTRERKAMVQLAIVLVCSFLTVLVSVLLSWIYAFQPQGRYLFPMIGMLAILVYSNRAHLNNLIVHAFIVGSFLLSVYSFIFWGIKNLIA